VEKKRDKYIIPLMESLLDIIEPAFEFNQSPSEQLALILYSRDRLLNPKLPDLQRRSIELNLMAWLLNISFLSTTQKPAD